MFICFGVYGKKQQDNIHNHSLNLCAWFRITLEKEAELDIMRSKKRAERDFFKKMENGEMDKEKIKEPKLLIGKLKEVYSYVLSKLEVSAHILN